MSLHEGHFSAETANATGEASPANKKGSLVRTEDGGVAPRLEGRKGKAVGAPLELLAHGQGVKGPVKRGGIKHREARKGAGRGGGGGEARRIRRRWSER